MPTPKVLLVRAPGTNCNVETAHAFTLAGAATETWHVNQVIERRQDLHNYQILCLPGGFSFGDDLGAGRVLALQIRSRLHEVLSEFREQDKLILGICNGFQALLQTGLLFAAESPTAATLTWNHSGRFLDCWVPLEVQAGKCVFLREIEQLYLPIAHAEGRFVAQSEAVLTELQHAGQLPLRYAQEQNPNGSQAAVAGMCDVTGRVFGLMPHPERFVDFTQHPHWTRLPRQDVGQGLALFRNAVAYFQ